jgi:3-hydroxyisobutyrate dehydrogenase-like beta-hydroxyacid dehydrogenase
MLPNDAAIMDVATQVLEHHSPENTVTHISCSTVSPVTSRHLAELYSAKGCAFVAAPVFARPDGIAKRQATWMVSGTEAGRATATKLLTPLGNVVDYGDDVGAANVVKLCGNFLIAVRALQC